MYSPPGHHCLYWLQVVNVLLQDAQAAPKQAAELRLRLLKCPQVEAHFNRYCERGTAWMHDLQLRCAGLAGTSKLTAYGFVRMCKECRLYGKGFKQVQRLTSCLHE